MAVSSATLREEDSPITLPRNSLSFLAHAPLTCSSGICDWVSMCTAPKLHGEASVVSQNLISCWLRLTLLTRPHEKICKRVLAHISADLHFLTATRAALSLVSCVVHLLASSHQFRDLASSTCDHSIDHAHCPASPWEDTCDPEHFPASERNPADARRGFAELFEDVSDHLLGISRDRNFFSQSQALVTPIQLTLLPPAPLCQATRNTKALKASRAEAIALFECSAVPRVSR